MGPEKKYSAGAIQATIWRNQVPGKEGADYLTVTLTRGYKDKDGSWKSTNSMRAMDIPKAVACLNKAFEYVIGLTDKQQQNAPTKKEDSSEQYYEEITV